MKPDVYEVTHGVTDHLAFTIEETNRGGVPPENLWGHL